MANPFMARCGIDCETCEYREKMNCSGCQTADGKMFWGECAVAACSMAKGHEHCGQCQEFPCVTLNDYSYDSEHGDGGERIRNLEAWNSEGYDTWRAKRAQ